MTKIKRKVNMEKKVGVSLPTEISVPATELGLYSILLFGEPKVGKTSLAAHFPDAFLLEFEPGGRAIRAFQKDVHSWSEFKEYLTLLEGTNRFKTVVMDTADIAYKMCLEWICQEKGFEHPSDESYGKGWSLVNSEFVAQIHRMLNLGRGVIFVSHAQEKEIKSRLGDTYEKIVPTMSGGGRAALEALADIWAYMYHGKEGRRWIRIRGNDHIAAGCRLKERFVGVEEINLGRSDEEAYRHFVSAFQKTSTDQKIPSTPRLTLAAKRS